MKMKAYLLIALVTFIATVSGSDVFARMTIGGNTLARALSEHLRWASLTLIGLALLCFPFMASAVACGRANRRARTRTTATIFCLALAVLGYFYFDAFQAAEHAMLERRWTAASLSIGLLPFFIGIPLWAVVEVLAFIATRVDQRRT